MLVRLALVLFVAAAASAQEPAPAAEQDPNVLLTLALRRLQTAEHVSASVEVKQEPPEQPAGQAGAGGMIIVQTQMLGEQEPFEGRIEACRAADGSVVLVSESELPGFALYVREGRTIERTTVEEKRFSLDEVRGEIPALLDLRSFAPRIFDAKLTPVRDAATGEITFRGKVEKDIVPPTGGEMAFFTRGRVLDAQATLVVTPDGRLKSAAVKITRSDPAREMMRGGQMRQIVIAAGGPAGALPPAEDDKKHDIPGGSTTYTLSFTENGLSARAKAFEEEADRLLRPVEQGDPLPPGRGADEHRSAPEEER